MSQEPPNSQPSPPAEPGGEPPKTTDNTTQSPPITANRSQSVFKIQAIKLLRGIIRLLEGTVAKLEEPSTPTQSGSFKQLQVGWQVILDKIRALLPENLSLKLSDLGLTSIIVVIVGLLLGTISISLLQEKPTKIATVPPSETITVPESEPPTDKIPSTTTPTTAPLPPKPDLLPDLTAPTEAKPIAIAPPPEPVLTPEQNLIAAIENQVAEVTDRYADGLIQSIQVNFQGSRLAIKVGDDWYTLNQSQQDKLASRMLERARQLDFSRLEITDLQGTLIARSPVVGDSMVILKRQGKNAE